MEGKSFLRSIRLQNILSFGPDTPELTLEPLNVLIGPNASGKSNLIEALSLLAAAPHDLQQPIREGGGVHEWLWKGAERLGSATMDVTLEYPKPIQHSWQVSEDLRRGPGREAVRVQAVFQGNDAALRSPRRVC